MIRIFSSRGDLVILVIEDDPNFAGIIFRFSHEKGFKCLHAADGETGLKTGGKIHARRRHP